MELTFTDTHQFLSIHDRDHCVPPCAFHAPSVHHMVTWPLHFRGDSGVLERMCPHGVGHPDPDGVAFAGRRGPRMQEAYATHGCDGCCCPPRSCRVDGCATAPDPECSGSITVGGRTGEFDLCRDHFSALLGKLADMSTSARPHEST